MKVLLPIEVPEGKYCWNYKDKICQHFDNEGGHPTCKIEMALGYCDMKQTKEGCLKPKECLKLKRS